MVAKFFGEFLLDQGLIDQEILNDVLVIQQECNLMLGEIAVSSGLLTQQQAENINQKQQNENKRFGEIAEDLSLLSHQQISDLLKQQKEQKKYFGDILIDLGILDSEQLAKQLRLHEYELNSAYQTMLKSIELHPLANYLTEAIDTTNRLFLRVIHEKSKFSQLLEKNNTLPCYEVVCQISMGIAGRAVVITMACNQKTATLVASKFTQQDIEDCDFEFSVDAFGEFLNIIVGNLIENITIANNASRSTVHSNINLQELCSNSEHLLIAQMGSQIGGFMIVISA